MTVLILSQINDLLQYCWSGELQCQVCSKKSSSNGLRGGWKPEFSAIYCWLGVISTSCEHPMLPSGANADHGGAFGRVERMRVPSSQFSKGCLDTSCPSTPASWVERHCNDGHVKQDTGRRQAPCRRRAGGGMGGFRDRGAKEGAWGEQTGLSPGTLRAALDGLTSTLVQHTSARQTSAPRD